MDTKDLEVRVNKKGTVSYWKGGILIGKKCTICGEDKQINEFNFREKKKGIYRSDCKECENKRKSKSKIYFDSERDLEVREVCGGITYWKNGVMVGRKCSTCGMDKPIVEFGFKNKEKGVYQTKCKKCVSEYDKQYHKQHYEENKEKRKEYHKRYRKDNEEKIKERGKRYYKNNKEKISLKSKQHYRDNKEKKREYGVQYYKNNIEKIKRRHKEYYEENKEKKREYHKQYSEINKNNNISEITNMLHQLNPILKELNIKAYGNIYKITNIKTGHIYIGQTTTSLKRRYGSSDIIEGWIKDRKRKAEQKFLDELENKEDFTVETIDCGICQYHLDKLEVYYIDKYDSFLNGYNNTPGNHVTDDGIEEFIQILEENNLEFIDNKIIKKRLPKQA